MKIEKIRTKKLKFENKLRKLRKQFKKDEREIVEDWEELMLKCSHPNLQGYKVGYCPDCGYMFG